MKENPVATSPKLEAKHLYRRLDALFRSIEKARTPRRLVEAFLDGVFRELAEPLKFRSASLYMERPSGFRLSKQMGETVRGAFDTLSARPDPPAGLTSVTAMASTPRTAAARPANAG